jgi:carbonic anhydrase
MPTRRLFLKIGLGGLILSPAWIAFARDAAMTKSAQTAMTPAEAIAELKAGNERFMSGKLRARDLMEQAKATASGQYPFAVVLGCIDSRVPPELVFDQGIGDIFSARVAGNFVNTDILGSLEFATKIAGAKAIVVLGHSACGAVKGAVDNARMGNLTQTLSNIMPALYSTTDVAGERNSKNAPFVQAVANTNVKLNVQALTERSAVLAELVSKGELQVAGAMHDLESGRVSWLA